MVVGLNACPLLWLFAPDPGESKSVSRCVLVERVRGVFLVFALFVVPSHIKVVCLKIVISSSRAGD